LRNFDHCHGSTLDNELEDIALVHAKIEQACIVGIAKLIEPLVSLKSSVELFERAASR
jgi:hypothetical protein